MNRTSINPTDWGLQFNFDQGEVIEGATRHLRCSGQISVKPDPSSELGVSVVSPNDMRGQIECALANVESILEQADMSKSNIVALRLFTTDVDGFLQNYDVYAAWISSARVRPPQSLIGIQRLVLPEALIELKLKRPPNNAAQRALKLFTLIPSAFYLGIYNGSNANGRAWPQPDPRISARRAKSPERLVK